MKKYQTIENLSDERLKNAYKELLMDKLPAKDASIVRVLQSELYYEQGKTVAFRSVQYHVAMEMVKRFCNVHTY